MNFSQILSDFGIINDSSISIEQMIDTYASIECIISDIEEDLNFDFALETMGVESSDENVNLQGLITRVRNAAEKIKRGKKNNDRKAINEGKTEMDKVIAETKEADKKTTDPEKKKKIKKIVAIILGVLATIATSIVIYNVGIKPIKKIREDTNKEIEDIRKKRENLKEETDAYVKKIKEDTKKEIENAESTITEVLKENGYNRDFTPIVQKNKQVIQLAQQVEKKISDVDSIDTTVSLQQASRIENAILALPAVGQTINQALTEDQKSKFSSEWTSADTKMRQQYRSAENKRIKALDEGPDQDNELKLLEKRMDELESEQDKLKNSKADAASIADVTDKLRRARKAWRKRYNDIFQEETDTERTAREFHDARVREIKQSYGQK